MKVLIVKKDPIKDIHINKLKKSLGDVSIKYDIISYSQVDELSSNIKKKNTEMRFDILISLGGDGTILKTVTLARILNIPILGINVGTIGFLTSINNIDKVKEYLKMLKNNKYYFDDRYLLDVVVKRKDKVLLRSYAINEATLTPKCLRKMGKYNVYIDSFDEIFNEYRADGLIISTPTGSTAHSLSAGGPIVESKVDCFIITAICPHAFNERSIIVSDKKKILIKTLNNDQIIDIDGRVEENLEIDDTIIISKIKKPVKFIIFEKNNFLNNIKYKIRNI